MKAQQDAHAEAVRELAELASAVATAAKYRDPEMIKITEWSIGGRPPAAADPGGSRGRLAKLGWHVVPLGELHDCRPEFAGSRGPPRLMFANAGGWWVVISPKSSGLPPRRFRGRSVAVGWALAMAGERAP